MYAQQYRDIAQDIGFRQFEMLKDAGVLVTQEQYSRLSEAQQKVYRRPFEKSKTTRDKNPLNKMFAGHYYNQKFEHYLEGSKGFKIDEKTISKYTGKELATIVTGGIKVVTGAVKALKGPLLVYRPASYVNSYLSNMIIYTVNSDDPLSPRKRWSQARESLTQYKSHLADSVDLTKTTDERAASKKALHGHELHYAFKSAIVNTIRSDAYKTASYKENNLVTAINDATGDDKMGNAFKTLLADPSTKTGAYLGDMFDATEMMPKVMMYLANKEKVGDKAAAQQVLLAFPTYNNLPTVLNAIDQISPYTKYMANYPKLVRYGLRNNQTKFLALNAAFIAGVRGTYGEEIDQDEQWWRDNNFLKMGGMGYKNIESLNSYWIPSKGVEGISMIDWDFPLSAVDSLTTLRKYSPWTLPTDD